MIPSKIAEKAEGKQRLLRAMQDSGRGALPSQQNWNIILLSLGDGLLDNIILKRLTNTDTGIQKGVLLEQKVREEHGHVCLAFQFL